MDIPGKIAEFLTGGLKKLHLDFLNPKTNVENKGNTSAKPVVKLKNVKDSNITIVQVIGEPTNEQLKQLEPIQQAFESKDVLFLEAEVKDTFDDIRSFEGDPHIKSLINFFKDKIPYRHLMLLRTGLYLDYLRRNGRKAEMAKTWRDLNNYGKTERALINLASAGYFNTYFKPLYQELVKNKDGIEKFNKIYKSTIEHLPFTIFVNHSMNAEKVINMTIEKAARNIKYGVSNDRLYIHGIGANVATVKEAVTKLRETFPVIRIRNPVRKVPIIVAKIDYRENKLSKEDIDEYV